ncbi:hypothetical protein [Nonlabens tegetincola]|uniref:hypothetical protein n=1 Tax=Nonlabens tegetincola TaxID=323273 RepID=UPI000CF5158C|nr:hypothetical protein [Nonlabens tegetincola]PQJ16981.1 hypothetical protein BST93_09915 [Nonlabens tegetincola]
MRKFTFLLCFLMTGVAFSQTTLDVVRLNLARTSMQDVEGDFEETDISNVNLEILYPTPLSSKTTLVTGLTVENTQIDNLFSLQGANFPNIFNSLEDDRLLMTRLNLGVKMKHSRKWTGNYVLLPKFASNFDGDLDNAFQFGAIAFMEMKKNSRRVYRFGMYSSTEEFGQIITPLVGVYYRTKNRKFTLDALLPIKMEANYYFSKKFALGADLRTSVKSYFLNGYSQDLYAQEESIRFGLYASYGLFKNQVLARIKAGFDTTDYGVYNTGDKVGAQVLTFQVSGDDRNRLNAEFDSSFFVGLDLIYRVGL